MASTHANKRPRRSARCAVSGMGVSTMRVVLLDGCLYLLETGKPLADFLGNSFVAVSILLTLHRRNILADGTLELLTGTAQLPVGTPDHACHLRQALRSEH